MNKALKKVVNYSTDRICLEKIDIDTYVTTDNLLQNKQGKVSVGKMPKQSSSNVTRFDKGDILVGNIRPYLKKIWLAQYTGGSSSDVLTFKVGKNYNSTFVYYSLFRDVFFEHMMNGSKGTKMPRGDKHQILDFPIPDFDLNSQNQIAKVLSDLDAKIEGNNQINEELEAMAKLVYDYWFVQFDFPISASYAAAVGKPELEGKPYKASGGKMIYNEELKREIPEGWSDGVIADLIKNDKSGDWGKEATQGNYVTKVSCVRGADINGLNGKGKVKTPSRFILEKNEHKILEPFDLVVEISGGSPKQSTGRLTYITESTLKRFENPLICSNFCKALQLKDSNYLYNFVFNWNRLYDAGVLFSWEGKTSGIKNLLFENFVNAYKIVLPTEETAEMFYDFMTPIQDKIQTNLKESQELSSLRDWLLPMLMNGQVTVGKSEKKLKSKLNLKKEVAGYGEEGDELRVAAEENDKYRKE